MKPLMILFTITILVFHQVTSEISHSQMTVTKYLDNNLCTMKFLLIKFTSRNVNCPDDTYRNAYLKDMQTFFKAIVDSSRKFPDDFNFLLGDNFTNFSISADIVYQHMENRYILRFETNPKNHARSLFRLCVKVKCEIPTTIPPSSTSAAPTPSKSTVNNSRRRVGQTSRYPFGLTSPTDREYQWFVATIFLSVLCFLLTCVVLFLVYVLQKKKNKFRALSSRRPKRPGELSNGVVHIPRSTNQQNTDGCTFYGDIERRKQRSQELRRSHSETSSISGATLPRGCHATGQSGLHTTTLPLRHHNPYANTQHSQLTVHDVQPDQPLLYNNNTIATVSTPRYEKFYNGLSVIGRHNNTLVIGEDSRRDPYVNGSIRAESQYACSSPNANLSHLNEERHELL